MIADIIAVALGLLVGLSLGALGGGGSTLAVPMLVFIAGFQAQDATTASLLVVGVASAFGVMGHARNGNVRLGSGIAFGAAGIGGSRIGLLLNRSLDENVLLLAFSGLIVFVAVRMWRSVTNRRAIPALQAESVGAPTLLPTLPPTLVPPHSPPVVLGRDRPGIRAESDPEQHDLHSTAGPSEDGPGGVATLTTARVRRSPSIDLSAPALVKLAGAATVVGLLTGLFGVGGGFAVVPALTLLLKFPAKQAIGTSLVVISINAAIALAMRAGDGAFDGGFDWPVVIAFLATVTIGVIVGTRLAKDIDADRLTRGFAAMLGAVAVYTAASTLLGA